MQLSPMQTTVGFTNIIRGYRLSVHLPYFSDWEPEPGYFAAIRIQFGSRSRPRFCMKKSKKSLTHTPVQRTFGLFKHDFFLLFWGDNFDRSDPDSQFGPDPLTQLNSDQIRIRNTAIQYFAAVFCLLTFWLGSLKILHWKICLIKIPLHVGMSS